MNSYQRLVSNTALFAISSFSSKVLVFLLVPFYTRVLSPADYGTAELLVQTGALLLPLASVGIGSAVVRFSLERGSDKRCVFTVGLLCNLFGLGLLLLAAPLLGKLSSLTPYTTWLLLFVIASNLHGLCSQFIRTLGHVRLFALDGLLRTALTILFNILLLKVFRCGVAGYVLANVASDALSAIFLFFRAGLARYVSLSALRGAAAAEMLRYCVPLIPNTVFSWIISLSDRYFINLMVGSSANGIYALANKIPAALILVATVFASAWELTALAERPREERERFFSNVFGVYQAAVFVVGSALILTAQITIRMLSTPEFYGAWRYVPVLVLATVFSCLSSFLTSLYMLDKRSVANLAITAAGAALNVAGNLLLIPRWGAMGAAVSTLASYALLFTVRAVHSRGILRIRWSVPRFLLSLALLSAQCLLIGCGAPHWPVWAAFCFLAVLALHCKWLLRALQKAI